jgi:hypothetical protein
MKKLVISALTASMASATALASESEWARLDRDVQALSASLSGLETTGPKISGYIRAAYFNSGDDYYAVDQGPLTEDSDLGDFDVLNARLKVSGTQGDVGYVLQFAGESAGTSSLLRDAYINVPIGGSLTVRAGQFKAIISRDSLVSSSKLFFTDRSEIGDLFAARREGIALLGTFEAFDWAITVQDGTDDAGDEYVFALRGVIHFLGDGVDMVEGAYGAPDDMEGTIGVSYWDDGTLEDGNGLLAEATLAASMYSINVWVADIADDLYTGNGSSEFFVADSTPFGLMGTFMITQPSPEQGGWELGARFQDMDDMVDTNIIDVGVNYYASGHDYKYFLNYKTIDSDTVEADIISVGLSLGF